MPLPPPPFPPVIPANTTPEERASLAAEHHARVQRWLAGARVSGLLLRCASAVMILLVIVVAWAIARGAP